MIFFSYSYLEVVYTNLGLTFFLLGLVTTKGRQPPIGDGNCLLAMDTTSFIASSLEFRGHKQVEM